MKLPFIAFFLSLASMHMQGQGQLLITEVSADQGISDIMGGSCDWLEILNSSEETINLEGYALSDDNDNWNDWIFPDHLLASGERILILASGKDKPYLADDWEFVVVDNAQWQYLVPTASIGDTWTDSGYNDSNWSTGTGGFGYGDGDDGTTLQNANSVFLRQEFTVDNVSDIGYMAFSIDYDDGYIAYLNGIEIGRSATMAASTGAFNTFAEENSESVLYAGGQPDVMYWEAEEITPLLIDGQNVLAVQVHNVSNTSSDMTARPFLALTSKTSADLNGDSEPIWWPSLTSWFHTSFKISSGESIILSSPTGNLVDVAPVNPLLRPGLTMGRADGTDDGWCIFDTPTPGLSNAGSTCYDGIESPPTFSAPSGWYENGLAVSLSGDDENSIIRYTTNGDIPNGGNALIASGAIGLNSTSVLSARAWSFDGTKVPSIVSDASYFLDEFNPDLPVISLITDYDNLWDWETGIYVYGANAEDNYPHFGANFWQPWSKPTRLQLFDETGSLEAEETLDLEIHGGWSRAEPQRSFRLDFKSIYSGPLDYALFDEKPEILAFNNINLRNGGQHSWATKLQDAALCRTALETHNEAGAWQPVLVYLNGEFWGLYGAREKLDEHFVADNFGGEASEVDLMNSWDVLNGSGNSFYSAVNSLLSTPTSNSNFYDLFAANFDVENYIDYFAFETYAQNTDWMGIAWGTNNVKCFREPLSNTWRYILYDNDASFGFFGASYWENFIEYARNPGYPSSHSQVFDRVLDNETFRHRFVNRYADLINTTFQTSTFNGVISDMMDEIESSMPYHIDRWNSPGSITDWLNAINNLTSHNANRIGSARSHINTSFGLQGQIDVTLDVFPPLAGAIQISTITPGPLPWDGIYFKGCPVDFKAIASAGWMFQQWDANDHTSLGELSASLSNQQVDLQQDDLFRARFEPCPTDGVAVLSTTGNVLSVETTGIPFIDSIAWYSNEVYLGQGDFFDVPFDGFYNAVVLFDGCSVVTESIWQGATSINNTTNTSVIHCSPNPTSNWVQITSPYPDLIVFNAIGQAVYNATSETFGMAGSSNWNISTAKWPSGTYSVHTGPHSHLLVVSH